MKAQRMGAKRNGRPTILNGSRSRRRCARAHNLRIAERTSDTRQARARGEWSVSQYDFDLGSKHGILQVRGIGKYTFQKPYRKGESRLRLEIL